MLDLKDFLRLFRQGKVSARSHMKNLIEMAMADGHFDEAEKALLFDIAKKYGINRKELSGIQQDPLSIRFVSPDDEWSRFEQLYELTQMMVIDGYIDSSEMKLCQMFAKKFGYNPLNVGELVDVMSQNIKNGSDCEETHKRVSLLNLAS